MWYIKSFCKFEEAVYIRRKFSCSLNHIQTTTEPENYSTMEKEGLGSFRRQQENPHDFYVHLNSVCELKATQETEILQNFVSDMLHRSSPNSQRRAQTLMRLAPRIETENKKYIKERMYRKLATEAENAVFGRPNSMNHKSMTGTGTDESEFAWKQHQNAVM